MKKIVLVFLVALFSYVANGQTATNFTCNDCTGVSHTLFDELDAGNVIVLCWVMPCGSCIGPTLTTYNVAQSFATTHPGRVKMYIADDYANTSCTSLTSWCNSNGFANTTKFSNASIKMSDYGTAGMPKIVVLGNTTHHVYYNSNNTVNATNLSNAILTALQDFGVGLSGQNTIGMIEAHPNPADHKLSVSFSLAQNSKVKIEVIDQINKKVLETPEEQLFVGEQKIVVNTSNLKNGLYIAQIRTEHGVSSLKFIVTH